MTKRILYPTLNNNSTNTVLLIYRYNVDEKNPFFSIVDNYKNNTQDILDFISLKEI